jgi:sulfonate transport system ATP-binding protein
VEETVTPADRIVLIEESRVAMDILVPLTRPRQRGHAMFAALVEKILARVLNTKAYSQDLAKGVSTLAKRQSKTYSLEKLDEY